MVDIKHPYRKILSQEEIDAKEKAYEESQLQKRTEGFELAEKLKVEEKALQDKGWSRMIITENPRPSEQELVEEIIEIANEITEETDIKREMEKLVVKETLEELDKGEDAKVVLNHEGKQECPECHEFFTKGGAFASHYKSHFDGD